MPGTMVAHQLISSIKSKCTPEEAMVLLKDLPNPLSEEESESRKGSLYTRKFYHQFYFNLFCPCGILGQIQNWTNFYSHYQNVVIDSMV